MTTAIGRGRDTPYGTWTTE